MKKIIFFLIIFSVALFLQSSQIVRADEYTGPADLSIESASFDNISNSFTYTVKNIGGRRISGAFPVNHALLGELGNILELHGGVRGYISLALDSGESISPTFTFDSMATGTVTIRTRLYSSADSNPDNNILDLSIVSIPDSVGLPDVLVENVVLTPLQLSYQIHNVGTGRLVGDIPVKVTWLNASGDEISHNFRYYEHILESGASVTKTNSIPFIRNLPTGAVSLQIFVNTDEAIYRDASLESNRNNNITTVAVPNSPDFIITSATRNSSGLNFTVFNNGTANFSGSLSYDPRWLRADGSSRLYGGDRNATVSINVGSSAVISDNSSFILNQPSQSSQLRISVNVEPGVVGEYVQNNNEYVLSMGVPTVYDGPPDFTVSNVVIYSTSTYYTITNNGGDFRGILPVKYEWLRADRTVINLLLGGGFYTMAASSSVSGAGGGYSFFEGRPANASFLRVQVNPTGFNHVGTEVNNTNNSTTVTVPDRLLPDFVIQNPQIISDNISFTLRNIGAGRHVGTIPHLLQWLDSEQRVLSTAVSGGYENLSTNDTAYYERIESDWFVRGKPTSARYLRITINQAGPIRVDESNTTNNVSLIAVAAPLFPDLTIESPVVTANSIQFNIRNRGTGEVRGVLPLYKLSWLDSERNSLNTILRGGGSGVLAAGSSQSQQFANVPFVLARPATAAFLRIEVNPTGDFHIDEVSGSNNTVDVALPAPPTGADLAVSDANYDQTLLNFTIANVGDANINQAVYYRLEWLDSGRTVLTSQGGSFERLAAGSSYSFTRGGDEDAFFLAKPIAAAYLRLVANPTGINYVSEINSTNNTVEFAVAIVSPPDFTIESAALTSSDIRFTIRNSGTDVFQGLLSHTLQWLDSDRNVLMTRGSAGTQNLPANGAVTYIRGTDYSFLLGMPAQAAYLRITVNASGTLRVAESNYSNNQTELTVQHSGLPDFIIDDLILSSENLRVTVKNIGEGNHIGIIHYVMQWLDADRSVLWSSGGGGFEVLEPDNSITYGHADAFILGRPDNAAYLYVVLNPPGDFHNSESDLSNNTWEVRLIEGDEDGEELLQDDEEEAREQLEDEVYNDEEESTNRLPASYQHVSLSNYGIYVSTSPKQKQTKPTSKYNPRFLPGTVPYFLKNIVKEVKSVFTFNPEKKAKLRQKYANEKLLEANLLLDKGKKDQAVKHLQRFSKDLDKLDKLAQKAIKKDSKNAEKFVVKTIKNQLAYSVLLEKFKRKTSAKEIKQIKKVQQQAVKHLGSAIGRAGNSKQVGHTLKTALAKSGNVFSSTQKMETLKRVEELVPSQAKIIIQKVRAETKARLKQQFNVLGKQETQLVDKYIKKISNAKQFTKVIKEIKTKKKIIPSVKGKTTETKTKQTEPADEKTIEIKKTESVKTKIEDKTKQTNSNDKKTIETKKVVPATKDKITETKTKQTEQADEKTVEVKKVEPVTTKTEEKTETKTVPTTKTEEDVTKTETKVVTPEKITCAIDVWSCGSWGACSASGKQTRSCVLKTDCPGISTAKPATTQTCAPKVTYPTSVNITISSAKISPQIVSLAKGGTIKMSNSSGKTSLTVVFSFGKTVIIKAGSTSSVTASSKAGSYTFYSKQNTKLIGNIKIY